MKLAAIFASAITCCLCISTTIGLHAQEAHAAHVNSEIDVLAIAQAEQLKAEQQLAQSRAARIDQRAQLHAAVAEAEKTLRQLRQQNTQLQQEYDNAQIVFEQAQREADHADFRRQQQRHALRTALALADQEPSAVSEQIKQYFQVQQTLLNQAGSVIITQQQIIDRQGNAQSLPLVQLGAITSVALGDHANNAGLIDQVGEVKRVAGPLLTPPQQAAVIALASGASAQVSATVPLDPSMSLAGQAAAEPWRFSKWLQAGGVFAYPIIAVVLIASIIVIERMIALSRLRAPPGFARKVLQSLEGQGPAAAMALVKAGKTPLARVMRTGIEALGFERKQREAALESCLLAEEPGFERSLNILAACAAVAPLLGLLGTVTGMIRTFDIIAVHGTGNPRLLSGGISEALVTTQMGLLVAVPILLLHAWVSRQVDKRQVRLEEAATALLAVDQQGKPSSHNLAASVE